MRMDEEEPEYRRESLTVNLLGSMRGPAYNCTVSTGFQGNTPKSVAGLLYNTTVAQDIEFRGIRKRKGVIKLFHQ